MLRCDAPMLRCAICCRCLCLEVMPQCYDLRFVDFAMVWKRCPGAKMYDLLPLLWCSSGVPVPRCTFCCRCFGLAMVPECKDVRFVAVALVSKWYDMLPLLLSRSGASMLNSHCQCQDARDAGFVGFSGFRAGKVQKAGPLMEVPTKYPS